MDIAKFQAELRAFVRERDWEKFHTPKNLAMALAGEAGELLEIFQWLTAEESASVMQDPKKALAVRDEIADVVVYCLRLSDVLKIDLSAAIKDKMKRNGEKYPAELARGKAVKYTDL